MKIFLTHSSKINYINELYEPIRQSNLNSEHEFIYFCDDPNYGNKVSKDIIKQCDLVVAEVSESSIGLGIEIGWADAFNIPIILVHKHGIAVKEYMRKIAKKVLEYNNKDDLINELNDAIQ